MSDARPLTEDYHLEKLIRSGATGSIFRATDQRSGETVAVKLLHGVDESSPAARERFLEAAEALQSLSHPSLPRLLDFGFSPGGSAFLVNEFVYGTSLDTHAGAATPRLLTLLLSVVDGLDALAGRGLTHGDLRAENLVVVAEDGEAQVKFLGLGHATAGAGEEERRRDLIALAELACRLLGATCERSAEPRVELPHGAAAELGDPLALRALLETLLTPDVPVPSYASVRQVMERARGPRPEAPPSPSPGRLAEMGTVRLERPARSGPPAEDRGTKPGVALPPPSPPAGGGTAMLKLSSLAPASSGADPAPRAATPSRPAAPPAEARPASGTVLLPLADLRSSRSADEALLDRTTAPPPPEPPAFDGREKTRPVFLPERPLGEAPEEHPGDMTIAHPLDGPLPFALPTAPPSWPPEPEPEPPSPPSLPPLPPLPPPAAPLPSPPPVPPPASAAPPPFSAGPPLPNAAPAVAAMPEPPTRPLPAAVPPPAPAAAAVTAPEKAPAVGRPGLPWMWIAAGGGLLALLAGGATVFALFVFGKEEKPASPPPPAAVAPAPAPTPAVPEAPSAPAVHSQILAAESFLSAGDLEGARLALAAIPPEVMATFSVEENDRYGQVVARLGPSPGEQLAAQLTQALRDGRPGALRLVVASAATVSPATLPPEVRRNLERARRIVDLDSRLTRAERAQNREDVLRHAAALLKELPKDGRAAALREQTAQAIENEADTAVAGGQLAAVLEILAPLARHWPDRAGLAARTGRVEREIAEDRRLASTLEAAAAAAGRNEPFEGLRLLDGVRPNARFADRFRDQRARLRDLAQRLDGASPQIRFGSEMRRDFNRGKTFTVPLTISDDYRVVGAEAWVRPEGGSYVKVPVRQVSGNQYEIEISPALHQDKAVDLYVQATDVSGHRGQLGSAERPERFRRKGFFSSLRGD